jgi:hypothetical protein
VIFTPSANLAVATSIVMLVAFALSGLVGWWWWPRTELARHLHWPVGQPVPFSHDHHVAGLGLDCRFCHSSVEVSAQAGMPPTHTCMTCHSPIWTNAQVLAPVRESFADHTPIAWNRVSDLPDYVYFDHSIHIVKGGGCQDCHGSIAHMPLTYKAESLTAVAALGADLQHPVAPRRRYASSRGIDAHLMTGVGRLPQGSITTARNPSIRRNWSASSRRPRMLPSDTTGSGR